MGFLHYTYKDWRHIVGEVGDDTFYLNTLKNEQKNGQSKNKTTIQAETI